MMMMTRISQQTMKVNGIDAKCLHIETKSAMNCHRSKSDKVAILDTFCSFPITRIKISVERFATRLFSFVIRLGLVQNWALDHQESASVTLNHIEGYWVCGFLKWTSISHLTKASIIICLRFVKVWKSPTDRRSILISGRAKFPKPCQCYRSVKGGFVSYPIEKY